MTGFRFKVGSNVMCNLGPDGWRLGRVIALHYREPSWPAKKTVPYQVALEADHTLIYVPEDDNRYCREATREDLRMARRIDALASLAPDGEGSDPADLGTVKDTQLRCQGHSEEPGNATYRSGQCCGCNVCPRSWSYTELYSEHYRCAERNGLKVTQHRVDLGTVRVGDSVEQKLDEGLAADEGFMQGATLVRLPPGLRFSDNGSLAGEVLFDPHRESTYRVEFVAVSTANWENSAVGIVRLEITLVVEGNEPPDGFDVDAFNRTQQEARIEAKNAVHEVWDLWERWERGALGNGETRSRIVAVLNRLRIQLEKYPRLDNGRWWGQLGGFYMNVHKLLENTLFECELYLGYALTFGDAEVRHMAERNLEGCYQKRLLEAARFMWMDGLQEMMRGEWAKAAETLRSAAAKKDGWGWAVNYGDIWLSEAAARLVHGAELAAGNGHEDAAGALWITEVQKLLAKGVARSATARDFLPNGHPWASEIDSAMTSYAELCENGLDTKDWLEEFKLRTLYWCAQVLGGGSPFPPKPSPRLVAAADLIQNLPGHNH